MKRFIARAARFLGYQRRTVPAVLVRSPDVFAVQKELIATERPVIFDVGAHVGYVTKKYRSIFPFASIHSFEPFPSSFEQLRRNTANDTLTTVHELAISETSGVIILHSNRSSLTNSLLATDHRGSSYWGEGRLETQERVAVTSTTLDSFCKEHSIPSIDILKLDVQGAEFSVLNGATNILSNRQVSVIYSEIIIAPTYQDQHTLHEYLRLLDCLGYDFFDLYNPVRKNSRLIQADFLFARRDAPVGVLGSGPDDGT